MPSNTEIRNVLVIGAAGNLGQIVLPGLLASGAFTVSILTRASTTASFPASATIIKADYDSEEDLVGAFTGQDAIVSTIGGAGFTQQRAFIDAAIKAGVKRFLPSELSSNTRSDAVRKLLPLFEAKQDILDYLKGKEGTGLTWTGLATGPMLDWGLKTGFLGFDLTARKAKIWDGGKTTFSATNEADIAAAVVSVLQHPVETANKYLYVETAAVSQKAILDSLEAATSSTWEVENVNTADSVALGRQLVAQGDFTGNFLLVQASTWGNGQGLRQNFSVDEELANSLLGLPKGDVHQTVRRVIQDIK
ncbi:hypothetical protein H2200_006015 [Cladophialophora chaetospira]|uniref:NmrA-like domain-containing protein n=1 Tax=Cladophialophora chaetospira TaxID=386627 RepID=A0AA39CIZ7_9EURO|nr:hypothetical protein H2200_006015 [Cladophialophora chaetospira]